MKAQRGRKARVAAQPPRQSEESGSRETGSSSEEGPDVPHVDRDAPDGIADLPTKFGGLDVEARRFWIVACDRPAKEKPRSKITDVLKAQDKALYVPKTWPLATNTVPARLSGLLELSNVCVRATTLAKREKLNGDEVLTLLESWWAGFIDTSPHLGRLIQRGPTLDSFLHAISTMFLDDNVVLEYRRAASNARQREGQSPGDFYEYFYKLHRALFTGPKEECDYLHDFYLGLSVDYRESNWALVERYLDDVCQPHASGPYTAEQKRGMTFKALEELLNTGESARLLNRAAIAGRRAIAPRSGDEAASRAKSGREAGGGGERAKTDEGATKRAKDREGRPSSRGGDKAAQDATSRREPGKRQRERPLAVRRRHAIRWSVLRLRRVWPRGARPW